MIRAWQNFWKRKPKDEEEENASLERARRILSRYGLKLTAKAEGIFSGKLPPCDPQTKARFRTDLVGYWQTALSLHQFEDNDRWTFRPDGTGGYERTDFGDPDLRIAFAWEAVGDFHIRVRAFTIEEYHSEEARFVTVPPDDDDPLSWSWQSFRYDVVKNWDDDICLRGELPLFPYVSHYEGYEGLRFAGEWSPVDAQ